MIALGAVTDDRALLDGMADWLERAVDARLVVAVSTVDALLVEEHAVDVVLLGARLRDGSGLLGDVRRLVDAGLRVLVHGDGLDFGQLVAVYLAGADGYLERRRDLHALSTTRVRIAGGGVTQPALSVREREVLVCYASGMTMTALARNLGIHEATAKKYLERVKEKHRLAGRPTYTKLDLANRAREDGFALGDDAS